MVENKCVDCGEEILDISKRKCNKCTKKPKKKQISNIEIISKFDTSRRRIKKSIENSVIKIITEEINKLSILKERFILNGTNQSLLNDKINSLILFRDKLVNNWQEIVKRDYPFEEENFDINKISRINDQ